MALLKRISETFDPLPPILADNKAKPDRRQLSKRWLAGIVFISFTSTTFLLLALFAALDGRTQLATPPELVSLYDLPGATPSLEGTKGNRLTLTLPKQTFIDRQKLQFSTSEKVGDKTLIRNQTFEKLHMMLAQQRDGVYKYPKFNILDIFADSENAVPSQDSANESDNRIAFTLLPFPTEDVKFSSVETIQDKEAEQTLRQSLLKLLSGERYYQLLPYHQDKSNEVDISKTPDIKVIQENLSIAVKNSNGASHDIYSEDIFPLEQGTPLLQILNKNNYRGIDAENLSKILNEFIDETTIEDGMIFRLGIEQKGEETRIVRGSIYQGVNHLITVALDDNDNYAKGDAPEMTSILKKALESGIPIRRISPNLPTVYDAIYRSVLSYNLSPDIARQLVRILATDIDLEGRVSPDATLDVLYPLKNNDDPKEQDIKQNVLYVSAKFGSLEKKYYRFQSDDGEIGYRDSEGHSAKQFLLRKPVPNGIFRSPFGIRRHPILGYVRMHTGVDWAAPRGSPIIAAGDGVVTKIGASRGYGNHTEIQHANGYMTSYSHQSGFARGLKKGTHVKQGQIIGYVGSTGLSTGPHCHFEVIVNGTKVDPMRVRIPQSKELQGKDLIAFKYERDQIDALLASSSSHQSNDILAPADGSQ